MAVFVKVRTQPGVAANELTDVALDGRLPAPNINLEKSAVRCIRHPRVKDKHKKIRRHTCNGQHQLTVNHYIMRIQSYYGMKTTRIHHQHAHNIIASLE